MNIKISLILIILLYFSNTKAGKIKIAVSNINQIDGEIHYGVYDNATLFPKEEGKLIGGFKKASDVLNTGITIENLEESYYAIAIYHDLNSNFKFDTFLAIPKEKYGFSNNAKVFFGPPKFNDASIFVGKNETVEIDIELR